MPEEIPMPAQQDRLLQHQETHSRSHPSAAGAARLRVEVQPAGVQGREGAGGCKTDCGPPLVVEMLQRNRGNRGAGGLAICFAGMTTRTSKNARKSSEEILRR